MKIKKTNLILIVLLAILTILLVSFVINLTARNDEIVSKKIATTVGRLEEEKVKMNVKIKEKLGNGIVYVLVKIESEEEIESVVFPNEDGTTLTLTPQSQRRTIAKDLKVELKKEYNVTINTKDGESVTKTILFEGDGTKENPFVIRTKEELQAVNEDLSAYYILGANIDLTDFTFTPIGNSQTPFTGNIDGTGYTISNLKVEDEEKDNIGLFSCNNGTISNITLENVTIKGKTNAGGLVGYNTGTVTGNKVSGNVTGLGDNVGGLIGQTTKGVTDNISRANVNGQSNTGGLVGYVYLTNKSATLNGNSAEGKVIGTSNVGGLVGYNRAYTTSIANYRIYLQQSYATGDVEGASNVGGLVGFQQAYASRGDVNSTSTINYIDQCYATGNIKATGNNAGGLVGYIDSVGEYHRSHDAWSQYANVVVQNSFATGKVEGATNIGGLIGYGIRRIVGAQCKAHIQIVNAYAIGEVTATAESGQAGGLAGAISASGSGNTTVTNSYWTPETTKQETSVLGTKNLIPYMMRKIGYDSWDFEDIWKIEEGQTIAYLKNVQKPESVNKENITYEEFDVIGEGTEESPFIITHPVQLQKITDRLNAYYKLGANIDLTGRTWTPIGTASAPFVGNIDGTGYIISNLGYDNETGENVGLFGYSNGTISNITLENVTIKGKTNAGGLVGYNTGTVTECIVKGNVTGLSDNVGLLIGYNSGSVTNNQTEGIVTGGGNNTGGLIGQTITEISSNMSKVEVHGQANTGGLVGYVYLTNRSATLSGNSAEGKVIGTSNVGGLVGYNRAYTTSIANYRIYLQQSYATGDVEGASNVGGLVGYQQSHAYRGDVNSTSTISYIDQCYATGNIVATQNNVGGLVGYIDSVGEYYRAHDSWSQYANVVIQNSFATGKVEGVNNIGGLIGYGIRRIVGDQCQAYIQIVNTYAIGEVVSEGQKGGLIGASASSGHGSTTVTDSFWNTETTKQETSVLGTAANTEGMTGTELYANWSSDIWTIEQGKYPILNF